jgi:Tryptophan dimethylallyltransferase
MDNTDIANQSFADYLCRVWEQVSADLGIPATQYVASARRVRDLLGSWAERPIGERSPYPSFVSADGFPAEMSINWKGDRPQVRILFESLGPEMTTLSCQQEGAELTRRLAKEPGVNLDHYYKIEDLFLPDSPLPGVGLIWHSLAWTPGQDPLYKVYFSARARGAENSYGLVEEAMGRLGHGTAWDFVRSRFGPDSDDRHELEFFALDLVDSEKARVKVYYRNHAVTVSELNDIAGVAGSHCPESALRAFGSMLGTATVHNEPLTCLAFNRNFTDTAAEASTYIRIPGLGTPERTGTRLIEDLMRAEGVDPAPYLSVMDGGRNGHEELLSIRTGRSEPDMSLYLRFNVYPGANS